MPQKNEQKVIDEMADNQFGRLRIDILPFLFQINKVLNTIEPEIAKFGGTLNRQTLDLSVPEKRGLSYFFRCTFDKSRRVYMIVFVYNIKEDLYKYYGVVPEDQSTKGYQRYM